MFIKCENCFRSYQIPDEKWSVAHPKFLRCTACGAVFSAQKEQISYTDDVVTSMPSKPMQHGVSLSEIFKEEHPVEQNESHLDTTNEKDSNPSFHVRGPIFEPVHKKTERSRLIAAVCACIMAFITVFVLFLICRFCFDEVKFTTSLLVHNKGLVFENTSFDLNEAHDLSVSSQLVNTSGQDQQIPQVIVILKNKQGIELQREYVFFQKRKIKSKERIEFKASLINIHPDASEIEIKTERQL